MTRRVTSAGAQLFFTPNWSLLAKFEEFATSLKAGAGIPMTEQVISPLRRRMIEDMAIRKLAPKTQQDYVQRVKEFAAFLGRSPYAATAENVRRF